MAFGQSGPSFDEKYAQQYVGKYVLIGLNFYDEAGGLECREQLHGVIVEITEKGVKVELKGLHEGEARSFPPDLSSLSVARRGTYTLHETGEVVENPDLLWTWDIKRRTP